jgi:tRNA G46 methylase TrmB
MKYETMLRHGEMTHCCYCTTLVLTGLICFQTDWVSMVGLSLQCDSDTDSSRIFIMLSYLKEALEAKRQFAYKRLEEEEEEKKKEDKKKEEEKKEEKKKEDAYTNIYGKQ